ncbi:Crp/Fnr family transcriptional regulator [Tabrizicola sp. BL-A-41-H6]|uniref:Crp/Fnr family transcriptional regulator n=1 Tax=Tabrizicola sp. BL-A-41-H6 TaxID=3421107 RepID=UPI003D663DAA
MNQFTSVAPVTNGHAIMAAVETARKPEPLRCSLPFGRAMICGAARYREDRAPDDKVLAGDAPGQHVWFIRSGILRLQRHAYDGHRQILSLFFPGEIVGFDGEFRGEVSVEAATQSSLCRIDRRKFETLVTENDALRADFFRQKQDQLDRLHWLTWSLGALGPEERLCAFLALSTRFMPFQPLPDGTGVLSVELPRKDIADLLGTTVESISRIVHRLDEAGIIEIRDPAHFRLLDLPGLVARGQIDGLFDRMTTGLAIRRHQIESLVAPDSADPICFCGR